MVHFIVVWMTRKQIGNIDVDENHYEVFENPLDAHQRYHEVLEDKHTYSANICVPIQSTDYDCAEYDALAKRLT